MCKYGPRFDIAIDKVFKMKFGVRKGFIIALSIISMITLVYVICGFTIGANNNMPPYVAIVSSYITTILFIVILILIFKGNKYRKLYDYCISRSIKCAEYLKEDSKALKEEFKQKLKIKDKEWTINKINEYYDIIEELKTQHINNEKNLVTKDKESKFDGHLIQLIGWLLLGGLVTICTLGIGFPIAYCWVLNWYYKHSIYDGKRVSFDGKPSQLIGKWIKWIILCIPTLGLYIFVIPKNLMQWRASHTHLEGELPFLGGYFTANAIGYFFMRILFNLLYLLSFVIFVPFIISFKNRYLLKHTVVDGRILKFTGHGANLLGRFLLWSLLSVITLSIYSWFIPMRFARWINKHTHLKEEYYELKVK